MKLIILLFIILSSCSFKKSTDDSSPNKENDSSQVQSSELDSDGDGTPDIEETSKGTDPFLADIPIVQGDLFSELKVNIELYNQNTKEVRNIEWSTKEGKTLLNWENEERRSSKGGIYMESLLKRYALSKDFKVGSFSFNDFNEGIYAYSSPLHLEDTAFEISNKILSIKRAGFEINRSEVKILSKFILSSNIFKSFRDPVFDIYYKSKGQEGLLFIESRRIDGTYSFNEENEIYINFENNDQLVINDALLSGGASLFVKLRDFTIYESGTNYSHILGTVLSKSLPLTIVYANEDELLKSKIETYYVGLNGGRETIKSILRKALKDNFLMTETNIDQVKGFSNRVRSYDQTGINETLKWFIGTPYLRDNLYNYQFGPNEGIGLAYISDKKNEKKPFYVYRSILSNGSISRSGKLPIGTSSVKLKLVARKVLTPFEFTNKVTQPNCPRGQYDTNEVYYKQIQVGWANQTDQILEHLKNDGFIKVTNATGSIIEGNISSLEKDGFLNLIPGTSKTTFDLKLSQKLNNKIAKENSQTSFEIFLRPKPSYINNGAMIETGRSCRLSNPDRSHGNTDGGVRGAMIGQTGFNPVQVSSGMGFAAESFERQYDLDIHYFSY